MNSVWEKLKNIGPDERKQGPLQPFGFVLLRLPCCMLEEGKDQLVNYSNIHLEIDQVYFGILPFPELLGLVYLCYSRTRVTPGFLWVDWLV